MKRTLSKYVRAISRALRRKALIAAKDLLYSGFFKIAGPLIREFSRGGGTLFPRSLASTRSGGFLIIPEHYYFPLVNPSSLAAPLEAERNLPGVHFNLEEQREFLLGFSTVDEVIGFRWLDDSESDSSTFRLGNSAFEAGDAEVLHHMVRHLKPRRVIEVGSGHSSKIISRARQFNSLETGEKSEHLAIEPFEKAWLENLSDTQVLRTKVENVDPAQFEKLERNDLLFIDSSHIIRPQGDVLRLYLEVLPTLKPGVVVHIHDFFSPRDYPAEWLIEKGLLWNEQYLVEAMLSSSSRYEILLSLSALMSKDFSSLKAVCPYLETIHSPGSLYLRINA